MTSNNPNDVTGPTDTEAELPTVLTERQREAIEQHFADSASIISRFIADLSKDVRDLKLTRFEALCAQGDLSDEDFWVVMTSISIVGIVGETVTAETFPCIHALLARLEGERQRQGRERDALRRGLSGDL